MRSQSVAKPMQRKRQMSVSKLWQLYRGRRTGGLGGRGGGRKPCYCTNYSHGAKEDSAPTPKANMSISSTPAANLVALNFAAICAIGSPWGS